MFESKLVEKTSIKKIIEKHIKKFCSDKGGMIKCVLDQPFYKMVLNHLVVGNKLVLELKEVKLSIDKIMEDWMKKQSVSLVVPNLWIYQYALLDYVKNKTFFGVMCVINMSKLLMVVNSLPDGKAAGLSGISNKLWKHDIGLVVEDMLKKGQKFWLVLQDMHKAYDLVGWHHLKTSLKQIKMCDRFIKFFSSIHDDRINRVMTNFGFLEGYRVHNSLDQKKTGKIKNSNGLSLFFVAGAFVDDTIWVSNCQTLTQYALNIASKFFSINNISINNDKTVAIPINQSVKIAALSING
ncbi:hypothetical protein G9A89_007992 [Geosiphon pyriformis]|nr:hypothetical protein G9A89_007992 [Geosiphon pyriformis]